jgi:hypothetical protein
VTVSKCISLPKGCYFIAGFEKRVINFMAETREWQDDVSRQLANINSMIGSNALANANQPARLARAGASIRSWGLPVTTLAELGELEGRIQNASEEDIDALVSTCIMRVLLVLHNQCLRPR